MRRFTAATLLMSLAIAGTTTGAFAADDAATTDAAKTTTTTTSTPAATTTTTKTKTEKAKSTSSGGGGGFFAGVGSFVAGTLVGIPVSMVRKSKTESINATKDLVGDTDNKFLIGAASILGVPAGIISGTIQGAVYGPINAYQGSKDEPFSPEAFSLGDSK